MSLLNQKLAIATTIHIFKAYLSLLNVFHMVSLNNMPSMTQLVILKMCLCTSTLETQLETSKIKTV